MKPKFNDNKQLCFLNKYPTLLSIQELLPITIKIGYINSYLPLNTEETHQLFRNQNLIHYRKIPLDSGTLLKIATLSFIM